MILIKALSMKKRINCVNISKKCAISVSLPLLYTQRKKQTLAKTYNKNAASAWGVFRPSTISTVLSAKISLTRKLYMAPDGLPRSWNLILNAAKNV